VSTGVGQEPTVETLLEWAAQMWIREHGGPQQVEHDTGVFAPGFISIATDAFYAAMREAP